MRKTNERIDKWVNGQLKAESAIISHLSSIPVDKRVQQCQVCSKELGEEHQVVWSDRWTETDRGMDG